MGLVNVDSENANNQDPAIQKVLAELQKVRSDLADEMIQRMEEEGLTNHAKHVRLEYILQSLQRGMASTPGGQVTIGPSQVPDKRTVAYSIKRIIFPEPMWSGNALPRVPLRKFFKDLMQVRQVAVEKAALVAPPVGADAKMTPEQEAYRKDILTLLSYCGENHYSLISLGSMLYGFLDALYAEYGAKKLLAYTFELRSLLAHYNAHDPHSNVTLERAALFEMRKLPTMCAAVAAYLKEDEFTSLVKATEAAKAKPVVIRSQADALLAAWGAIPAANITTAAGASAMRVRTSDRGIPTKAVMLIRAQEVAVDLDRSRPVSTVVEEIGEKASQVVEDGLLQVSRALEIAQAANYNLATGEWGSYYLLSDNERKMREIEPLIFQKALGSAVVDEMLPPIFYLITEYTTFLLPTRIAYGEVIFSESVKPGQTLKIRVTTGTTTKQSTAQSQTILEEQSSEALAEYQDELNRTVADKCNITTDDQQYLSTSDSVATNRYWDLTTQVDVQAEAGKASKEMFSDWAVSASLGFNCGENTDINRERETELTQQVTAEREASNETQTKALQKHVGKQAAKRSTNVTVATDTATEITKQEARTEEFTNPSSVAPMTVISRRIYQEYAAVRAITNFHVAFLNGVDYTMKPISAFNEMMATYLDLSRADTVASVGGFKQLLRIVGRIPDYMGREVNALVEKNGGFAFRTGPYHKLLPQGLTEDDIDLEPIKDRVAGIVIDVTPYRVPTAGAYTECFMGPIALDKNTLTTFAMSVHDHQLDQSQKTTDIEGSQIANNYSRVSADIMKAVFENVLKTNKVTDVERFQVDAAFKILKDIREMFDKRQYLDLERKGKGGDDGDDAFAGAPPKKD